MGNLQLELSNNGVDVIQSVAGFPDCSAFHSFSASIHFEPQKTGCEQGSTPPGQEDLNFWYED